MNTIFGRFIWMFLPAFFSMGTLFADIQFPSLSEIKQSLNSGSKEVILQNKYKFIIETPKDWPKEVFGLKSTGNIEPNIVIPTYYIGVPESSLPPKYNDLFSESGQQWGPSITGLYGTRWEVQSETASIIVHVKYNYKANDETVYKRMPLKISITFDRVRGSEALIKQIIQTGTGTNPEDFSIRPSTFSEPNRIFSKAMAQSADTLVEQNDAQDKPAKAVWLLRESSSIPGALAVTYYDKQSDAPTGFGSKLYVLDKQHGWIFVSASRFAALKGPQKDTFIPISAESEKGPLASIQLDLLYVKLESEGFKKEGQIIP